MRSFLAAVVVLVGLALGVAPAMAQAPAPAPLSQSERDDIARVIRTQMDAFRRDDAAGAFRFASPALRDRFGQDPDQFMAMVRHGYAPVTRPARTLFGVTELVEGSIVQHVDIEGPDGVTHTALYTMEREADGQWRIAACVLLDTGDVGA